ncbi:hypothetical protein KP509_1Z291500 [Ceratopteris richardii]|nr:hypothetical protein KP509_1Z291500 [Ceratopteris richardii]
MNWSSHIRKCFLRRADGFSDRRMPLDCGRSRTDYSNYSQDDSIELSTGDNGSSSSRNWSHPPAGIDLNSSPIDRNSPRSSDSTSMSAALLHLQLQRAALDDAHDDLLEASSLPASYHLFRGSLLKLARRPQTGYKATKSPALWPLLPHIEERQVQHSSGRKGQAAHSASLVVRNVPSCSDTRRPSNPRKRPANAIFEGAFYNEDVYKSVPEQILDIDNVFPRHNRGTNILLSQPSKCKFSSGLQVPKCRYVCEQPDSICKNQHAAAFPEKASIDSCWRSARERSKMIGTTYELCCLSEVHIQEAFRHVPMQFHLVHMMKTSSLKKMQ